MIYDNYLYTLEIKDADPLVCTYETMLLIDDNISSKKLLWDEWEYSHKIYKGLVYQNTYWESNLFILVEQEGRKYKMLDYDYVPEEVYTVQDILDRGYNLTPLKCVHCGHVGEVVFLQYIGDGLCEMCGKYQIDDSDTGIPF
jgi:hypothetical protein